MVDSGLTQCHESHLLGVLRLSLLYCPTRYLHVADSSFKSSRQVCLYWKFLPESSELRSHFVVFICPTEIWSESIKEVALRKVQILFPNEREWIRVGRQKVSTTMLCSSQVQLLIYSFTNSFIRIRGS